MSFDNFYPNRKDIRAKYHRRGRNCRSCRPNGGCPYCLSDRMYTTRKRMLTSQLASSEYGVAERIVDGDQPTQLAPGRLM